MLIEIVDGRHYMSMNTEEALKLIGDLSKATSHALNYGHSSFGFGQGVTFLNKGKSVPGVLNITVLKG